MSIRPVTVKTQSNLASSKCKVSVRPQIKSKPSFTGKLPFHSGSGAMIWLMDALAAGGFAASFVVQDFCGMAAPRTIRAVYRNKDQNNGKYNWGYARLVGVREILSGPSSFIIPSLMLLGIKKAGSANNVPVNYIKGFSGNFASFVQEHPELAGDPEALKEGFYKDTFKNVLKNSLDKIPSGKKEVEIEKKANDYASKLIEAETAPKHFVWNKWIKNDKKFGKELKTEIVKDFEKLNKEFSDNMPTDFSNCSYKVKNEILSPEVLTSEKTSKEMKKVLKNTPIDSFMHNLTDFTNDAINQVSKKAPKNIQKYMKDFADRRIGTRFLSNILMTAAVIGFYTVIPKLYNQKDGKNPALVGLDGSQAKDNKKGKEVKTNA